MEEAVDMPADVRSRGKKLLLQINKREIGGWREVDDGENLWGDEI